MANSSKKEKKDLEKEKETTNEEDGKTWLQIKDDIAELKN